MRTPGFSQDSGQLLPSQPGARIALGPPALDRMLGGGLLCTRVHEIVPETVFQLGAAAGFALAVAALSKREGAIVWIQQGLAALEGGAPYGPGGAAFGIAASQFLLVKTATPRDALWAMEESLRCAGVAVVLAELASGGDAADLTATRRLNLVAQSHGVLPLLLRQQPPGGTSACATRWRVAAAPGSHDGLGGIGRTAFALTLAKNQHGPCGRWQVEWNDHERDFRTALPVAVAAPVFDRSPRAA